MAPEDAFHEIKSASVWGMDLEAINGIKLFEDFPDFVYFDEFICLPSINALAVVGRNLYGNRMVDVIKGNTKLANNRNSGKIIFKSDTISRVDIVQHGSDMVAIGFDKNSTIKEIYHIFVKQYQIFLENNSSNFNAKITLQGSDSSHSAIATGSLELDMIEPSLFPKVSVNKDVKCAIDTNNEIDLETGFNFDGPVFDIELDLQKSNLLREKIEEDNDNPTQIIKRVEKAFEFDYSYDMDAIEKVGNYLFSFTTFKFSNFKEEDNDNNYNHLFGFYELTNSTHYSGLYYGKIFSIENCQNFQVHKIDPSNYAFFALCDSTFSSSLQVAIIDVKSILGTWVDQTKFRHTY